MPRKTHCSRGHARTPENVERSGNCRLCRLERVRAWRVANAGPKNPKRVAAGKRAYKTRTKRQVSQAFLDAARNRKSRNTPVVQPSAAAIDPDIAVYRDEKARRAERVQHAIADARSQLSRSA